MASRPQLLNVLGKHVWRLGGRKENATTGEFWCYTLGGCALCGLYVIFDVIALDFTAQSVISACCGMGARAALAAGTQHVGRLTRGDKAQRATGV